MTADWVSPEDLAEEDEYFSEFLEDAELTGKEPKFVRLTELDSDINSMNVIQLITTYRAERDQLATDRKGYKSREERIKLHMSMISMLLRTKGDIEHTDSFQTAAGTAYRTKTTKFGINDWEAYSKWVLQTGYVHALQKRVAVNNMKEIIEQEGLPPGIEVRVEESFAVRSPTAGKRRK